MQCKQILKGHAGGVLCAVFNSDGTYCISGGQDRTIKLWNVNTATEIQTYRVGIAVRKDNAAFASCGDKIVYIWDVLAGKFLRKLHGHISRVNCVCFGPPGEDSVLVSCSNDATVRVWDLRTHGRDPMQVLTESRDSVTFVRTTGHEIITAGVDGYIRTYDMRQGKAIHDNTGSAITAAALSHDEQCILVAHLNGTLQLFDRAGGDLLATYKGHVNSKYRLGCTFSGDDANIICGSEDGYVYVYDLVDANVISVLKGHVGVVTDVNMYHKDHDVLLSCGADGTIRIWSA